MKYPTDSPGETTKITSCVRRVSSVLKSGSFLVPWHQRKYDWSTGEVDDLLQDLREALERDKTCYFLGSIMLFQSDGNAVWRINDGQQRLITISLLIASLCRRFASSGAQVPEYFAMRALFNVPDDASPSFDQASRYEPRIQPPTHDKEKYRQLLQGGDVSTGGLLVSAWDTVERFVGSLPSEDRIGMFHYLDRKVEISVLNIPIEVDENLVFETLNARGKRLEDVDLLRNHLYSYFPDSVEPVRRETLQDHLERPRSILGTKRLPDYFRSFLQCQYGFLPKARMYRMARARIEKEANRSEPQEYVFALASNLGRRRNVDLFGRISLGRTSETLDGNLPRVPGKRSLDVLLQELQTYRVSRPLCFALLHRFLSARGTDRRAIRPAVVRGLRNLNSFIMRSVFVSASFRPSKIEEALAETARQVFEGTDRSSLEILEALQRNDVFDVVQDLSFVRRVEEAEFRPGAARGGNQKALRCLFAINAQEQAGSDALDVAGCSVEHVLPESRRYWPSWPGFNDVDPSAWVYRLGNMVVLSRNENRGSERFNSSYEVKREAFERSPIKMARDVSRSYSEWDPAVVGRRSKDLAKAAARIWRFWT